MTPFTSTRVTRYDLLSACGVTQLEICLLCSLSLLDAPSTPCAVLPRPPLAVLPRTARTRFARTSHLESSLTRRDPRGLALRRSPLRAGRRVRVVHHRRRRLLRDRREPQGLPRVRRGPLRFYEERNDGSSRSDGDAAHHTEVIQTPVDGCPDALPRSKSDDKKSPSPSPSRLSRSTTRSCAPRPAPTARPAARRSSSAAASRSPAARSREFDANKPLDQHTRVVVVVER